MATVLMLKKRCVSLHGCSSSSMSGAEGKKSIKTHTTQSVHCRVQQTAAHTAQIKHLGNVFAKCQLFSLHVGSNSRYLADVFFLFLLDTNLETDFHVVRIAQTKWQMGKYFGRFAVLRRKLHSFETDEK